MAARSEPDLDPGVLAEGWHLSKDANLFQDDAEANFNSLSEDLLRQQITQNIPSQTVLLCSIKPVWTTLLLPSYLNALG